MKPITFERRPSRLMLRVRPGWGLLLVLASGCALRPEFFEAPGTVYYQRSRAVVHDPYPDNSIGPPVVGGRPYGFERPQSEPVKAQTSPFARRPGY